MGTDELLKDLWIGCDCNHRGECWHCAARSCVFTLQRTIVKWQFLSGAVPEVLCEEPDCIEERGHAGLHTVPAINEQSPV